jgi:hypothetical protein
VCERHGVTKSQVVVQAIKEYVERDSVSQPTLGELGRDLFGADRSPLPPGQNNVSGRVKQLLDRKLRAKHSR